MGNASDDRVVAWNDNDTAFDLKLEKFGIDTDALTNPLIPKRRFCCWVEDWEKPLFENNHIVSMTRLLQKYKDLVFLCPDNKIIYTASNKMLFIPPGKKDGWAVLGIPEGEDGKDTNTLQPFTLCDNIIGVMVKDTEHPQESFIQLERERPINSDEFNNSDDESDAS